jgi:hypothetical protein
MNVALQNSEMNDLRMSSFLVERDVRKYASQGYSPMSSAPLSSPRVDSPSLDVSQNAEDDFADKEVVRRRRERENRPNVFTFVL